MILLLLLSLNALAEEKLQVQFVDEEREVELLTLDGALLDSKSVNNKGSKARKALRGESASKRKAPKALPANPDGTICANLGGRVTVAKMPNESFRGFCRFSDGSLVDNLALWSAAKKRANR